MCIQNLQKKSITVHIKSQRPSKFKIEEAVMVPDVETLNNLHQVRHEFTSSIIRSDYKSFYSEKDMEVFKDFRSRAKYGIFDIKDRRDPDDLVEIDITKAYTAAFEKIDKVPVFNEFDIWKPYNDEPIKDLNLYLVETTWRESYDRPQVIQLDSVFFDRKVCLCYGKFLNKRRHHIKKIFGVKTPSNIKKINCKKMVDELYKKTISTNSQLDMRLKKDVVNICLGVLEKTKNKRSITMVFDTLKEAYYYKQQVGGTLNI